MARIRGEIVRSTLPTSGATVDYTLAGLGFTPSLAIVLASRATSYGAAADGAGMSVGYCAASSQFARGSSSRHSQPASSSWHSDSESACLVLPSSVDGSTECALSFDSFISNGVRLGVDTAAPAAWRSTTLLFGGDGFEVVGSGTFTTAAAGVPSDVSAPGAEAVFVWPGGTSLAAANGGLIFGCAVDASPSPSQGAMVQRSESGADPTNLIYLNEVRYVSYSLSFAGVQSDLVEVTAFDPDGFTVVGPLSPVTCHYVAIGTGRRCQTVFSLGTLPTSAGTWQETGVGFRPQLGILWQNHSHIVGSSENGARAGTWGLGAFTDDDEASHSYQDRDGQADTDTSSFAAAKGANILTGTGATGTDGSFASMDEDGFSFSMATVGSPARRWPFFLLGVDRSLEGSGGVELDGAGVLGGKGALVGAGAGLSLGASGDLGGSGALSGTAGVVLAAAGDLAGTGELAGSAGLALSAAGGPLTGTGALAGSAQLSLAAAGDLAGTGALAGSAGVSLAAAGALVGLGALSGAAGLALSAAGAMRGLAAASGSAGLALATTGLLRGLGALSGSAQLELDGAPDGTLAGTGALVGAGGALALSGDGTLVDGEKLQGGGGLTLGASGVLRGLGALEGAAGLSLGADGELRGTAPLAAGDAGLSLGASGDLGGVGALAGSAGLTLAAGGDLAENILVGAGAPLALAAAGTLTGTGALVGAGAGVVFGGAAAVSVADPRSLLGIVTAAYGAVRAAAITAGLEVQYEGETFDEPAGAYAEAQVLFDACTQLHFGYLQRFRTEGGVLVRIRTPLEQGSAAGLAAADLIKAALRESTVSAVHLGEPSVLSRGEVLSRWQHEVRVPFYVDEDVPRVESSGYTTNRGIEDVSIVCTSRFDALVAQVLGATVQYDNETVDPADDLFVRLTVIPGASDLTDGRYRTQGVLMGNFRYPTGAGGGLGWQAVEAMRVAFRAVTDRGVTFKSPCPGAVRRDGGFWMVTMSCPFQFES